MYTKSKPSLFSYVSGKWKYVMLSSTTGAVKAISHAIFSYKKWACLEKRTMCPQGGFTNNQLCWFQITREVKQLFKTRIGLNFFKPYFH